MGLYWAVLRHSALKVTSMELIEPPVPELTFGVVTTSRVKPCRDLVGQRVGDVFRFLSFSSDRHPDKGSCSLRNADTSGVQSARRTRPWLCDNPVGSNLTRRSAERGSDSRAVPALSEKLLQREERSYLAVANSHARRRNHVSLDDNKIVPRGQ